MATPNYAYDPVADQVSILANPGVDTRYTFQMYADTASGRAYSAPFTVDLKDMTPLPVAGVQIFDVNGNSSGYGGSSDPEGVFYGMSGFAATDKWWAEDVPSGATVTPLAGGSFTLAVTALMAPGNYSFTAVRWNSISNTITRITKAFTVT